MTHQVERRARFYSLSNFWEHRMQVIGCPAMLYCLKAARLDRDALVCTYLHFGPKPRNERILQRSPFCCRRISRTKARQIANPHVHLPALDTTRQNKRIRENRGWFGGMVDGSVGIDGQC